MLTYSITARLKKHPETIKREKIFGLIAKMAFTLGSEKRIQSDLKYKE
ncbi:hypothetical protein GCM10028895_06080 [Pontibacter rugosus]